MSPRIWVRVITIAVIAFALLQPAFTQTKGSGTTGTGTTTGTTGTTTGLGTTTTRGYPPAGDPNSTTNSTNNPSAGTLPPPPIMVSGRVMLEDGTAPTDSVLIERVCNGNPRAEGYTDARGYFVLQLGSSNSQFQDASESAGGFGRTSQQLGGLGGLGGLGVGGLGSGAGMGSSTHTSGLNDPRLLNCELRARLSGYRSQTVSLMEHSALDNPDIGVILLHRLAPTESAATVSAAAVSGLSKRHESIIATVTITHSPTAANPYAIPSLPSASSCEKTTNCPCPAITDIRSPGPNTAYPSAAAVSTTNPHSDSV